MPFPFAEAAFILNSGRAFGDVVGLSFFTQGRALPAAALRFPHSLHENRFALPRNKIGDSSASATLMWIYHL
jgi:hypothetical protein